MLKTVVVCLVGRHDCRLDRQVGCDLPLDLPAELLPQRVTISHLAKFHAHVGLHCLQKCLTSFVPDLVPLQLQRGERLVRLPYVVCDGNGSSVADLVPPEVERLDEIPTREEFTQLLDMLVSKTLVLGSNDGRTHDSPGLDGGVEVGCYLGFFIKLDLHELVHIHASRLEMLLNCPVHCGLVIDTGDEVLVEAVRHHIDCVQAHVDLGDHILEGCQTLVTDATAAADVEVVQM